MSDLEAEQDKASGLAVSLEAAQRDLEGAVNAKDVAEARAKQLQVQVGRANDATVSLTQQLGTLKDVVQVRGKGGVGREWDGRERSGRLKGCGEERRRGGD